MSCYGDFFEAYIKLSNFSLRSLGKRAVLAVSDAKSKDGRKLRNVSLENHSQISEESRRIQDPVQLTRTNLKRQ